MIGKPFAHPGRKLIATVVWLRLVLPLSAAAGEKLTVEVRSGRQFVGYVSSASDENYLRLVTQVESAQLVRPIEWSAVTRILRGGDELPLDELRQTLRGGSDGARAPVAPARTSPTRLNLRSWTYDRGESAMAAEAVETVRSVSFLAETSNWDPDPLPDGLWLRLQPRNRLDQMVAVRGYVEVWLWGYRSRGDQRYGLGTRLEPVELGFWRAAISPADFGNASGEGALLRLPFASLPFDGSTGELDSSIGSWGLIQLKLVVPGQGVFRHELDGVRIRPYQPVRILLNRGPSG